MSEDNTGFVSVESQYDDYSMHITKELRSFSIVEVVATSIYIDTAILCVTRLVNLGYCHILDIETYLVEEVNEDEGESISEIWITLERTPLLETLDVKDSVHLESLFMDPFDHKSLQKFQHLLHEAHGICPKALLKQLPSFLHNLGHTYQCDAQHGIILSQVIKYCLKRASTPLFKELIACFEQLVKGENRQFSKRLLSELLIGVGYHIKKFKNDYATLDKLKYSELHTLIKSVHLVLPYSSKFARDSITSILNGYLQQNDIASGKKIKYRFSRPLPEDVIVIQRLSFSNKKIPPLPMEIKRPSLHVPLSLTMKTRESVKWLKYPSLKYEGTNGTIFRGTKYHVDLFYSYVYEEKPLKDQDKEYLIAKFLGVKSIGTIHLEVDYKISEILHHICQMYDVRNVYSKLIQLIDTPVKISKTASMNSLIDISFDEMHAITMENNMSLEKAHGSIPCIHFINTYSNMRLNAVRILDVLIRQFISIVQEKDIKTLLKALNQRMDLEFQDFKTEFYKHIVQVLSYFPNDMSIKKGILISHVLNIKKNMNVTASLDAIYKMVENFSSSRNLVDILVLVVYLIKYEDHFNPHHCLTLLTILEKILLSNNSNRFHDDFCQIAFLLENPLKWNRKLVLRILTFICKQFVDVKPILITTILRTMQWGNPILDVDEEVFALYALYYASYLLNESHITLLCPFLKSTASMSNKNDQWILEYHVREENEPIAWISAHTIWNILKSFKEIHIPNFNVFLCHLFDTLKIPYGQLHAIIFQILHKISTYSTYTEQFIMENNILDYILGLDIEDILRKAMSYQADFLMFYIRTWMLVSNNNVYLPSLNVKLPQYFNMEFPKGASPFDYKGQLNALVLSILTNRASCDTFEMSLLDFLVSELSVPDQFDDVYRILEIYIQSSHPFPLSVLNKMHHIFNVLNKDSNVLFYTLTHQGYPLPNEVLETFFLKWIKTPSSSLSSMLYKVKENQDLPDAIFFPLEMENISHRYLSLKPTSEEKSAYWAFIMEKTLEGYPVYAITANCLKSSLRQKCCYQVLRNLLINDQYSVSHIHVASFVFSFSFELTHNLLDIMYMKNISFPLSYYRMIQDDMNNVRKLVGYENLSRLMLRAISQGFHWIESHVLIFISRVYLLGPTIKVHLDAIYHLLPSILDMYSPESIVMPLVKLFIQGLEKKIHVDSICLKGLKMIYSYKETSTHAILTQAQFDIFVQGFIHNSDPELWPIYRSIIQNVAGSRMEHLNKSLLNAHLQAYAMLHRAFSDGNVLTFILELNKVIKDDLDVVKKTITSKIISTKVKTLCSVWTNDVLDALILWCLIHPIPHVQTCIHEICKVLLDRIDVERNNQYIFLPRYTTFKNEHEDYHQLYHVAYKQDFSRHFAFEAYLKEIFKIPYILKNLSDFSPIDVLDIYWTGLHNHGPLLTKYLFEYVHNITHLYFDQRNVESVFTKHLSHDHPIIRYLCFISLRKMKKITKRHLMDIMKATDYQFNVSESNAEDLDFVETILLCLNSARSSEKAKNQIQIQQLEEKLVDWVSLIDPEKVPSFRELITQLKHQIATPQQTIKILKKLLIILLLNVDGNEVLHLFDSKWLSTINISTSNKYWTNPWDGSSLKSIWLHDMIHSKLQNPSSRVSNAVVALSYHLEHLIPIEAAKHFDACILRIEHLDTVAREIKSIANHKDFIVNYSIPRPCPLEAYKYHSQAILLLKPLLRSTWNDRITRKIGYMEHDLHQLLYRGFDTINLENWILTLEPNPNVLMSFIAILAKYNVSPHHQKRISSLISKEKEYISLNQVAEWVHKEVLDIPLQKSLISMTSALFPNNRKLSRAYSALIQDAMRFQSNIPSISQWFQMRQQELSQKDKSLFQSKEFDLVRNARIEFLAVMNQVVHSQFKFDFRVIQWIAHVLFFDRTFDTGLLLQIGKGEGKSILVNVLAILLCLQGYQVNILTHSASQARRYVQEFSSFYEIFELRCAENSDILEYQQGVKPCYHAHVVYGEASQFQSDMLRHDYLMLNTLGDRRERQKGEVLILDNLDNLLFEDAHITSTLTYNIPGHMDMFPVCVHIWDTLTLVIERIASVNGQYIALNVDPLSKDGKDALRSISQNGSMESVLRYGTPIDVDIQTFLIEQVEEKVLPLLKDSTNIPSLPLAYVKEHLKSWILNACLAYSVYQENIDYIVEFDRITPLNHRQGAIEWNENLMDFLSLKHRIPMAQHGFKSLEISNAAYFNKYKTRIFGVSHALGSSHRRDMLSEIYTLDTIVLPTSMNTVRHQYPTLILENETSWLTHIADAVSMEIDLRPVFVLCDSIYDIHILYHAIKESFPTICVDLWTHDVSDLYLKVYHFNAPKVILCPFKSDMRFKYTLPMMDLGGLHQIVAFMPNTLKVQEMAFIEQGSVQIIANQSTLASHFVNTRNYIKAQEDHEIEMVKIFKNHKYHELIFMFKMFNKFKYLMQQNIQLIHSNIPHIQEMSMIGVHDIWNRFVKRMTKMRGQSNFIEQEFNNVLTSELLSHLNKDTQIQNPHHYVYLGHLMVESGHFKDAMSFYMKAKAIQPELPMIYLGLANLTAQSQDLYRSMNASTRSFLVQAVDGVKKELSFYAQYASKLVNQNSKNTQLYTHIYAMTHHLENILCHLNASLNELALYTVSASLGNHKELFIHLNREDMDKHINCFGFDYFSILYPPYASDYLYQNLETFPSVHISLKIENLNVPKIRMLFNPHAEYLRIPLKDALDVLRENKDKKVILSNFGDALSSSLLGQQLDAMNLLHYVAQTMPDHNTLVDLIVIHGNKTFFEYFDILQDTRMDIVTDTLRIQDGLHILEQIQCKNASISLTGVDYVRLKDHITRQQMVVDMKESSSVDKGMYTQKTVFKKSIFTYDGKQDFHTASLDIHIVKDILRFVMDSSNAHCILTLKNVKLKPNFKVTTHMKEFFFRFIPTPLHPITSTVLAIAHRLRSTDTPFWFKLSKIPGHKAFKSILSKSHVDTPPIYMQSIKKLQPLNVWDKAYMELNDRGYRLLDIKQNEK